jgi:hypothetical protein
MSEEETGIQVITAIMPFATTMSRREFALVEFRCEVPKFLFELVVNPLGD